MEHGVRCGSQQQPAASQSLMQRHGARLSPVGAKVLGCDRTGLAGIPANGAWWGGSISEGDVGRGQVMEQSGEVPGG